MFGMRSFIRTYAVKCEIWLYVEKLYIYKPKIQTIKCHILGLIIKSDFG